MLVSKLFNLLYVFFQGSPLYEELFARQMLPFRCALFQQGFHGRLLADGRFGGSRLCVLGLGPRTQEHRALDTFIGIGPTNHLRSGSNHSFTSLEGDVFCVICHRLLSIPGAGMERERWTDEEGRGSANRLCSRTTGPGAS